MTKRRRVLSLAVITVAVLVPALAFATPTALPDVFIGSDEVVERNYYAAGETVDIAGDIQGDAIIGASDEIIISGTVSGDVIVAAPSVVISGTIEGNVRAAGGEITISGTVMKNVSAFGGEITFDEQSTVGWSTLAMGDEVIIRGATSGHVTVWAAQANIAGVVGGNIDYHAIHPTSLLTVHEKADVSGDLQYWAAREARIDPGAMIAGATSYEFDEQPGIPWGVEKVNWTAVRYLFKFGSMLGMFLVGLALIVVIPGFVKRTAERMNTKPLPTLGWGVVYLIVAPIIIAFVFATVIGIPLGILGVTLYGLAIGTGSIFAGTAIGLLILRKKRIERSHLIWAMLLGVLVFTIATAIPYLGWFIGFLGIAWAFGGIVAIKRETITAENREVFK